MILAIFLITTNFLAFILYGIDKWNAKRGARRISEFTLIAIAIIGGAIGAFIGMFLWHHKTRKKKFTIIVPIFLSLQIIVSTFCLIQNYYLVTTQYEYHSEILPDNLDGYKIVQISDLHNQFFGIKQSGLLKKISAQNPDIIVVTGDALDSSHTCYKFAEDFFEGAVKIAPVYYITGNQEGWLNPERFNSFVKKIEGMGVNFIDNEVIEQDNIIIAGLSDKSLKNASGMVDFDNKTINNKTNDTNNLVENNDNDTNSTDNRKLKILLAHEPKYLGDYSKTGADIVFSGHIHGGQIIIPGVGGLLSPDFEFFPKLCYGEHVYADTIMYISRGLGNSALPVRINNYPEIVVVTLHKR